ncbi:MAG TPA: PaaI family thioesterase [Acidimicrobiales bacterium]|nr:PaaI family thioesterase [Acidimicrobiales bacterium]
MTTRAGAFHLSLEELEQTYTADRKAAGVSSEDEHGYNITEYAAGRILAWTEVSGRHARKGGTIAGAVLFGFFDALGYMVTLAQSPKGTEAFTTDVSIHFLRPGPLGRFTIEGRALRFGRRSSVVAITVTSPEVPEGPVASGVITFAPVFPKRAGGGAER